jgi:hypothetical protein
MFLFLWQWLIYYRNTAGHCPLSEAYLIYTTFPELTVLPSSGDRLSLYWQLFSILLVTTARMEPGTIRRLGLYTNYLTTGGLLMLHVQFSYSAVEGAILNKFLNLVDWWPVLLFWFSVLLSVHDFCLTSLYAMFLIPRVFYYFRFGYFSQICVACQYNDNQSTEDGITNVPQWTISDMVFL